MHADAFQHIRDNQQDVPISSQTIPLHVER
jgi:hypothetical protein